MLEVTTYWDSVLIADNCLPEDLLGQAKKSLCHGLKMDLGTVENTPKKDNEYLCTEKISANFVADWLLSSGLIPKLDSHDIKYCVRHHRMEKGGKMTWHCDGCYSIAATCYFSECVGGELEVESPCGTHSLSIKPMNNRVVVIKCDNRHRVAEVLDGKRDSLQIFYTFLKGAHDGDLGNYQ